MSDLKYRKLLVMFLVALFFTLSIQTSAYAGVSPIFFEKFTNGFDADIPPGPEIPVGDPVEWTYNVTNISADDVLNIDVVDNQIGAICNIGILSPGESEACTAQGTAQSGQYVNIGTVTGSVGNNGLDVEPNNGPITFQDPSHYFGVIPNQPPDCSGASPSINTLWPPNHKFASVNILGVTDPDGDPVTIIIDSIHQDEPVGKEPDGMGIGTSTAQVRSERSGKGNGRVYEISFTSEDGQGGSCTGVVYISVPHDQSGMPAIDDGPLYDSTTAE